jgi:GTPase Era involved in 16S rRNA processing
MSTVKLVEEIVREKVFQKVNSEVTYKILPQTIGWTYKVDGILRIDMHLYLSKKSHFVCQFQKGEKRVTGRTPFKGGVGWEY